MGIPGWSLAVRMFSSPLGAAVAFLNGSFPPQPAAAR